MWWRRRDDEAALIADMFDPDWYAATYRDVALSGLSPYKHYLRYGRALDRDPMPDLPIGFYRDILQVPAASSPLAALTQRQSAGTDRADPAEAKRVLVAAAQLAEGGRDALAIDLARHWLPEGLHYSIEILRANAALRGGDRSEWLARLNTYLGHFGLAPVVLRDGPGDLWSRLACDAPPPPVAQGPLVSVLVAAWNAEATIDMAARSILAQTWRNIEVLIVDDRSSDGTWAKMQAIAAADPRVRIFRNSVNTGPYVAKNIALSQAQGFFITGHDADDWAHPERIARQVRFCLGGGHPACLASMLRMSPQGEFVRLNRIGLRVHDGASRAAFIGLMVDAQVMHGALGGWDEVRVGGDSELIGRLETMLKHPLHSPDAPVMLCLDNPSGLTNHSTLGHSERGGVSPYRLEYKAQYTQWHRTAPPEALRHEIPMTSRPFPAPEPMKNAVHVVAQLMQDYAARGLRLREDVEADVAIVTNLAYLGGNTASTLDEIAFFAAHGLRVVVVHAPTLRDTWRAAAPAYATAPARFVNWNRVASLRAPVVIVRNPVAVAAPAFAALAPRIEAGHAFVVINNSVNRASGVPAYDPAAMLRAARAIRTDHLTFCPISVDMRAELTTMDAGAGGPLRLADGDWLPTMSAERFLLAPKPAMSTPYVIGRHGRDGPEKWRHSRTELLASYPQTPEFRVSFLGGANRAIRTLGEVPDNWTVVPFGAVRPEDYLRDLDVFVYFPQQGLVEGFGRAIAEAMLAGVPAVLPPHFASVFGDMAFYTEPEGVPDMVRALARDDAGRVAFLTEVQQIVLARHGIEGIGSRFRDTDLALGGGGAVAAPALTDTALAWRHGVLKGAGHS